MHTVKYEHRTQGSIEKFEYVFFARAEHGVGTVDAEEIYDRKRFTEDELFALEPGREIHLFIQELLEQNGDLLEIL